MICGEGETWEPREDNQLKKAKRRVNNTYINLVLVSYLVLLLMFKRTHSAAQHSTAKRRARHGTALRCAAELYRAGLT